MELVLLETLLMMGKLTVQICLMKQAAVKHVSIKELVHITLKYVAQPPSRMSAHLSHGLFIHLFNA